MNDWLNSSMFSGANQDYLEQMYEDYLLDPHSVDESWATIFKHFSTEHVTSDQFHSKVKHYFRELAKDNQRYIPKAHDPEVDAKLVKVLEMIHAFRVRGHQNAKIDPIKLRQKAPIYDLEAAFYGFTDVDMEQRFNISSNAFGVETIKLSELYDALKATYCGSIGVEFMHLTSVDEREWIQSRLESERGQYAFSTEEKTQFLRELTAAEGLERYIGTKFPGAKRFSLEGGDALIPMLKEMIRHGSKQGAHEVVLGMAHRGRLNVLINIMGKKPRVLFDEFAGKQELALGTGDVKYHQGYSSYVEIGEGVTHLTLAFNPSHLEIVSPVVMGATRARLDRLMQPDARSFIPITLHGDAAVIGQGITQETLNMSQTRAYKIGGTIRIVINNQIGFTTSYPDDCRSSEYCTDIAKMIQSPIFHVNGDDPEAIAFVSQLAVDFRDQFQRDIFIDLMCYRRHGHNEADEPSVTQPMMYQKIHQHPTCREAYADKLITQNLLNLEDVRVMVNDYRESLEKGERAVDWREVDRKSSLWTSYLQQDWTTPYANEVNIARLQSLQARISDVPDDIEMHPRVQKIYQTRAAMAKGDKPFDWGGAETLAYATLVDMGLPVRISGEDAGRGTFFHRHAVVHNQKDGSSYVPLTHIHPSQGKFAVWDSVLSEAGVLAFEYGYATTEPRGLTIWEAQFGDFANGAQVVIDQFISSGEQKWGRFCGLVMLLPHGYEGQGPEHSSARLERYLQLCAEQNIQVCVPSTPAQVYHMLRRQALRPVRKPLIVMSPKSLLRHPLAISTLEELANGEFQPVIDEIDALDPRKVKRVVLCSGKIYYELLIKRREQKIDDIAILRIEQLYPFPTQMIEALIQTRYRHVNDFVWCQEEPQNQGAWYCSRHNFQAVVPDGANLRYVGRVASASPAVGYMSLHLAQQQALINESLLIE